MPPPTSINVANIEEMFIKQPMMMAIIVAVIVGGGAYWFGNSTGHAAGYAQAQADVKALQDESATKAATEAAKSANPFQAVNPLEGVEANPFEKVKKVLNPFETE